MKSLIAKLAIVMAIILLNSCETPKHFFTIVAVDKTGSGINYSANHPSVEKLEQVIKTSDPDAVRTFWFTDISDVSMNAIKRFHIGSNGTWDNPHNRTDSLSVFYRRVNKSLNDLFTSSNTKPESSVYLSLCDLLNNLAKAKADYKTLLLYSDLLENSTVSGVSFYHTPPTETNYEAFVKTLEKKAVLNNLSGIEIIVVYSPTLQTDKLFYSAKVFFWEKLLKSKGANIRFVANL